MIYYLLYKHLYKMASTSTKCKGYIYKLFCNDLSITKVYVGSSEDLNHRLLCHKSNCNNPKSLGYNLKVYKFIRLNGGWDNWSMSVIDEDDFESKKELVKRERKWIEDLRAELNSNIPGRTLKEYYEDHKEELQEKGRKYNEENKEKRKEYGIIYYQKRKDDLKQKIECECGSIVSKYNMSAHRKTKKHKKYIENL